MVDAFRSDPVGARILDPPLHQRKPNPAPGEGLGNACMVDDQQLIAEIVDVAHFAARSGGNAAKICLSHNSHRCTRRQVDSPEEV